MHACIACASAFKFSTAVQVGPFSPHEMACQGQRPLSEGPPLAGPIAREAGPGWRGGRAAGARKNATRRLRDCLFGMAIWSSNPPLVVVPTKFWILFSTVRAHIGFLAEVPGAGAAFQGGAWGTQIHTHAHTLCATSFEADGPHAEHVAGLNSWPTSSEMAGRIRASAATRSTGSPHVVSL